MTHANQYTWASIDDRFWSKVNFNGPVPSYAPHLGQCWLWTASLSKGYGRFAESKNARSVGAHRWAYETRTGRIPAGLHLDHLCRVTSCVRPSHLEPVTSGVNTLRSPITITALNVPKTACPLGHPYDVTTKQGWRRCRTCMRVATRAYKRRRRLGAAA